MGEGVLRTFRLLKKGENKRKTSQRRSQHVKIVLVLSHFYIALKTMEQTHFSALVAGELE